MRKIIPTTFDKTLRLDQVGKLKSGFLSLREASFIKTSNGIMTIHFKEPMIVQKCNTLWSLIAKTNEIKSNSYSFIAARCRANLLVINVLRFLNLKRVLLNVVTTSLATGFTSDVATGFEWCIKCQLETGLVIIYALTT